MTGIGTQIKNALGWFLTRLKGNVVNNLTSTSTDLPLSAAKGKDLQDQITSLNTNIHTVDLAVSPNIGVNVYDAFTIPALKIAVVSLMIPAANVGAGMIMCGIDVVPSKSSYAALNGYSGKDGQVYVTPGNMAIYCDSSSNNGDGRATLVFRYR